MLETRPISACAKFKPVEQVKSEISSVELIAELIEIELQEICFDIVIRVKDTPLYIAYGYVYPWKHLADHGLVLHLICFMLSDNFVRCKCRVRLRGICGGISSGIYEILYSVFLRSRLQVRYDIHLDMTDPFPGAVLLHWCVCRNRTFRRDKHGRLPLAPMSTLERKSFFTLRRLRGEESFIKFHLVKQLVEAVTLAHHVTQLMQHFLDGLVAFPSKLALYLQGGYGPLRTYYQKHCHEPIENWQFTALHHCAGTEGNLMTAIHTCPRLMARIPTEVQAATFRTIKSMAFTKFPESVLTGFLVRINFIEISQVHNHSFPIVKYKPTIFIPRIVQAV